MNATEASVTRPIGALLGRGGVYTLASVLQLSSTLLVLPIATRLLRPHDFGVVTVAIVIQNVVAAAGTGGLAEIAARTYFGSANGPSRARAFTVFAGITSLMVAILASLTETYWGRLLGDAPSIALQIGVWSGGLLALVLVAQSILRAQAAVKNYVAVAALAGAGSQAVALAFVLTHRSPGAFLLGNAAAMGVAAIVAVRLAGLDLHWAANTAFFRHSLQLASPTILHTLALYLLWAGDRAVIGHMLGTSAAGRYQVAYLVGGLPVIFLSALYNAWNPIVFATSDDRRWRVLADTRDALYTVTPLAVGLVALAAPLALELGAPASYEPARLVRTTAIISFSALPFVAYAANLNVILWHGRTEILAWATPLAAATNIGLIVALVHPLGLAGAAIATVVGYGVLGALLRINAQRLSDVPRSVGSATKAWTVGLLAAGAGGFLPVSGADWIVVRAVSVIALVFVAARVVSERLRSELVATSARFGSAG